MRILFIPHRFPYPPNKGEKIRSYNILRALSDNHDVDVVVPVDDQRDLDGLDELKSIAHTVHYQPITKNRRITRSLYAVMRGRSISVDHFYSRELQRQLDTLLDENSYDAVFCSSSPTAEYIFRSRHSGNPKAFGLKIVDLIDVDSIKWGELSKTSSWHMARVYRYECRVLARFEKKICDLFDRVLLTTKQEVENLSKHASTDRVYAIGNGVDFKYFQDNADQASSHNELNIVFTGMMGYEPNVDGMRWFIERVLPLITEQVGGVRLSIVGANPTDEVKNWSGVEGITVTGFVDDVRPYISAADICIAPLLIGQGVQNKVLEAMAMSKPVVCTSQAIAGIDAEAGKMVLVADDAVQFAEHILRLHRFPDLRNSMGMAARGRIEERYSWSKQLGPLLEMLLDCQSQDALDGSRRQSQSVDD